MSIGGYFELEIPFREEYYNDNEVIRLNTGRNALEYILRSKKYKKIYLPYFTCDVILEPIQKQNIDFEFYHIDKTFLPIFDYQKIAKDEVFLYNNYFGICDKQVDIVVSNAKNIIIDNAQAFYSKPLPSVDTFYSPRKFFGLSDGAYLFTDKLLDISLERDISYTRFEHLLGRIDINAESCFQIYKDNAKILSGQPIKRISKLTHRILKSIDYNTTAEIRKQNFNYIHDQIGDKNQLNCNIDKSSVPMVYPLLLNKGYEIKKKLIQNRIYVATYWPNVLHWSKENSFEYYLSNNLLALPIDQRYHYQDMKRIIDIISKLI